MHTMKPQTLAKKAAQFAMDPWETINEEAITPLATNFASEFGSFFGAKKLGKNPKEIAGDDLKRARNEQRLAEMDKKDSKTSHEEEEQIRIQIREKFRQEYQAQTQVANEEQNKLKTEFVELQEEVAKLAQVAGVETKAHLENVPKKIGILDIKRLTSIVMSLRIKAEESKSAKELVTQRQNAKPATGMLAWVSGKQMKIHEQGTLQLQG